MTAVPRLKKRSCVFPAPVDGEKLPDLLKVGVMYGPNASGKSNFMLALDLIDKVASRRADIPGPLPVTPFRFDPKLLEEPSTVEVHFLAGRCRYEFVLSLTRDRITHERLTSYPKGVEVLLYDRKLVDGQEVYITDGLEGGKELHEAWKKLTPHRALFISQAVASSSDDLRQLAVPHAWLTAAIFSFTSKKILQIAERSLRLARDQETGDVHCADIAAFLSDVDVPVTKIHVEQPEQIPEPLYGAQSNALNLLALNSSDIPRPPQLARRAAVFTHSTALGQAEFAFDEESEGTQNLVGFWLPWSTRTPNDEYPQCILAVDELDSSLHPAIVANLVKKHLEAGVPSQLIFTTHDTHLMDSGLLRRDQFWIAERNMDGATELRSIHDFLGREGEDIEKRYFEGRYRGLPLVQG